MHQPNVVSWNAMIAAYVQNGCYKEAIRLFRQMLREDVKPNKITFISILNACASLSALAEGKLTHADIVNSGIDSDVVVGTALVTMYGKCGSVEDARRVFDSLPKRDVVSWNAMIAGYARHGYNQEALQLFGQMNQEGVKPDKNTFISILNVCASPAALADGKLIHALIVDSRMDSNVVVGTALVNMYGKCGNLEDARQMFNKMPKRNVVSWTAMIAAYAKHGHGKEALDLFRQMHQEGVKPDKITFVSILNACTSSTALTEGKLIHSHIVDSGFESDVVVGTALVNMYGKCGNLEDAWRMFNKMPERNVVSWNAMTAAYAQHGQGKEALQLFQQMQREGFIPDRVTFISILSACSHTGLVDDGCKYFVSMHQDYGITPTVEHYNCMVDLLGRAGRLDEGEDLINNMPFEPTVTSWMALLGACRMHFDVERGERSAKHVFELEPQNSAPYVSLSNIYATAGRWDDAVKVRKLMKGKGLEKQPGCSLIEVKE